MNEEDRREEEAESVREDKGGMRRREEVEKEGLEEKGNRDSRVQISPYQMRKIKIHGPDRDKDIFTMRFHSQTRLITHTQIHLSLVVLILLNYCVPSTANKDDWA